MEQFVIRAPQAILTRWGARADAPAAYDAGEVVTLWGRCGLCA